MPNPAHRTRGGSKLVFQVTRNHSDFSKYLGPSSYRAWSAAIKSSTPSSLCERVRKSMGWILVLLSARRDVNSYHLSYIDCLGCPRWRAFMLFAQHDQPSSPSPLLHEKKPVPLSAIEAGSALINGWWFFLLSRPTTAS